ncbi:MAG: HdeD family acid-resistance protein [Isosphaeraceae bacterium]|nr:HdeD family acid-resistance protein [Isosphaeraceae bacterium]
MKPILIKGVPAPLLHDLAELRSRAGSMMIVGILTLVLGGFMILAPIATSMGTMMFLSAMLIVSGISNIIGAFYVRCWSGFTLQLLAGVLNLVLGVLTIDRPLEFSAILTLLIASLLFVGGIFRVVGSFFTQFDGWLWICISGVISIALAVMIWRQWPISGTYVIGLFIGLDVIALGWTWVMLSLAVRKLPKPVEAAQARGVA